MQGRTLNLALCFCYDSLQSISFLCIVPNSHLCFSLDKNYNQPENKHGTHGTKHGVWQMYGSFPKGWFHSMFVFGGVLRNVDQDKWWLHWLHAMLYAMLDVCCGLNSYHHRCAKYKGNCEVNLMKFRVSFWLNHNAVAIELSPTQVPSRPSWQMKQDGWTLLPEL